VGLGQHLQVLVFKQPCLPLIVDLVKLHRKAILPANLKKNPLPALSQIVVSV
jgi:hypothetical protein